MTLEYLYPEFADNARDGARDSSEDAEIQEHPPLDLDGKLEHCLMCGAELGGDETYERWRVCPSCRFHYTISARQRINAVVDPDTFEESRAWLEAIDPITFSPRVSYQVRVLNDQVRTGLNEAVVTGVGRIGGARCAIIAIDFGFLGGSMGLVVGEKVARVFEDAARRRLPVVTFATSGGPRLQEGVLSLTQMAKTIVASRNLRKNRLPLITVLANPSSGQILASFASMSDIRIGEPGAHIAFASLGTLREIEDLEHVEQLASAETMLHRGHLDMIADRTAQRDQLAALLGLFRTDVKDNVRRPRRAIRYRHMRHDAWESVRLSRRADRPKASDYIPAVFRNFIPLHGDRFGADDPSITIGIGYLGINPVMLIAHERQHDGDPPPNPLPQTAAGTQTPPDDPSLHMGPDIENQGRGEADGRATDAADAADNIASYTEQFGNAELDRGGINVQAFRKARRAAKMAGDFSFPLVVLIDTPGPKLGIDEELNGLASEIAAMINVMLDIETPIVSAVIGEGGGEAALAFSIADRVLMMENSIFTPISPEAGAATELHDRARAPELARSLRLTAYDAYRMGIADRLIAEPEHGANENLADAARTLRQVLTSEVRTFRRRTPRVLARKRRQRFRSVGEYGPQFQAALRSEVRTWGNAFSNRMRRVFGNRSPPSPPSP